MTHQPEMRVVTHFWLRTCCHFQIGPELLCSLAADSVHQSYTQHFLFVHKNQNLHMYVKSTTCVLSVKNKILVEILELRNMCPCVLRCGMRNMTCVSLVFGKNISEWLWVTQHLQMCAMIRSAKHDVRIGSYREKDKWMSLTELPNISPCVLKCGVQSTTCVSLVKEKK